MWWQPGITWPTWCISWCSHRSSMTGGYDDTVLFIIFTIWVLLCLIPECKAEDNTEMLVKIGECLQSNVLIIIIEIVQNQPSSRFTWPPFYLQCFLFPWKKKMSSCISTFLFKHPSSANKMLQLQSVMHSPLCSQKEHIHTAHKALVHVDCRSVHEGRSLCSCFMV